MSFASAGHTNLQPRPSTPMSLQLLFLASSSITCTQSAEDGSPIPTQVLPSCTFTITPLLTKVKFTDWPITYLHTHCPPPPLPCPHPQKYCSKLLKRHAFSFCFPITPGINCFRSALTACEFTMQEALLPIYLVLWKKKPINQTTSCPQQQKYQMSKRT